LGICRYIYDYQANILCLLRESSYGTSVYKNYSRKFLINQAFSAFRYKQNTLFQSAEETERICDLLIAATFTRKLCRN
jgi:hypothetical protein